MSTLARRTLPENPAARALLIAERLQAITGTQRQVLTCWRCLTDHPAESDGWKDAHGDLPVCADEDECNDRAAAAGLVPVDGEPADKGGR